MRKFFSGTLLLGIGLLAACSDGQPPSATASAGRSATRLASLDAPRMPGYGAATRSVLTSFGSLPDHGDLVVYDRKQVRQQRGAYTAYPVALSEAHALNAIGAGRELSITAPDGSQIRLQYDRHVESPDGDWSWIGHDTNGNQAQLTFGEQAVFGSIPQTSGEPLRLTMSAGKAWMIATDRSKLAGLVPATIGDGQDQPVPPQQMADIVSRGAPPVTALDSPSVSAAAVAPTATIDVLLGYTSGLSSELGGDNAAKTRLFDIVTAANVAYSNSGIAIGARLVGTVKVDYPDNTDNGDTLEKLTGQKRDGTAITPDPAFTALRAARETTGADLVSLVRAFRNPENNGCGIAWLIGGGGKPFTAASAGYGYSVIGDGTDARGGGTTNYYCSRNTLAHEMGHNMGQQHDVGNSNNLAGVHPYSYGYRESTASGFHTIMAYPLTNGSETQTDIAYFANPNIKFADRPTGVADVADNVRSMNQTMPVVASFRATKTAPQDTAPNLLGVFKLGSTATEAHILTSASAFKTFSLHTATGLGRSNDSWVFELGDYNGDGVLDLWCILKVGSSGKTEVHILNGADKYKTYLLHAATVLPSTGTDSAWVFKLADYNKDGKLDLWAISKRGGSGKTEVHVLNGATKFSTYLAHVATVLAATGSNDAWKFELGDYDKDGKLDIYAIAKGYTGSGRTEMHILSGGDNFQSYITHIVTPLGFLGQDNSWEMKLGDYNGDGVLDLYAIAKVGASGKTEVHILDGASGFQSYKLHASTGLGTTGAGHTWEFLLLNR